MWIGAHMPVSGFIWTPLEYGSELGCEVVQFFLKNNRRWTGREFSETEVKEFNRLRHKYAYKVLFAHASYLVNLAAADMVVWQRSIQGLISELRLAGRLGLPFLVLHPGYHGGAGESQGLQRITKALEIVLAETAEERVRVALETTAGQGTALGYRLEHLEWIYSQCRHSGRLAICLDTAHLYAAGYPINTLEGWDALIQEVNRRFGLDQIVAVHLNDCAAGLGMRIDRHVHIGQGSIGMRAFGYIVNDSRFKFIPGCIETPKDRGFHADRLNLRKLRNLRNVGSAGLGAVS